MVRKSYRDVFVKFSYYYFLSPRALACEQQMHFRSSLLSISTSLRKFFEGREATTGNASAVRRLPMPGGGGSN